LDSQAREACALIAELGFVLAGFAAIAMSLRSERSEEWPPAARVRAQGLLFASLVPGLLAMLALGFSASGIADGIIYRIVSALWFGVTAPFSYIAYQSQRRLAEAPDSSVEFGSVGILLWAATAVAMVLQVANALVLGLFWPLFVAFFVQLLSAAGAFYRLMFFGSR
jgi:small-conductance mechanosensitive channel